MEWETGMGNGNEERETGNDVHGKRNPENGKHETRRGACTCSRMENEEQLIR